MAKRLRTYRPPVNVFAVDRMPDIPQFLMCEDGLYRNVAQLIPSRAKRKPDHIPAFVAIDGLVLKGRIQKSGNHFVFIVNREDPNARLIKPDHHFLDPNFRLKEREGGL